MTHSDNRPADISNRAGELENNLLAFRRLALNSIALSKLAGKQIAHSSEMDYQKIILCIIAIVAFLGNTFTVLLFLRKSKWLKKTYNCLILALAIQDILLAVSIIALPGFIFKNDSYTVTSNGIAGWTYCKFVWSHFIPFSLGITSVYTCLMLTFDRWLAVVKPLSYKKYEQSRLVVFLTVLFPWAAGMCFEITAPLNASQSQQNGTILCHWKRQEYSSKTVFFAAFSFTGMMLVPAILMVTAYGLIIVHMKRSQTRVNVLRGGSDLNRRNTSTVLSLKRVTVTACIASTIVIVSWLPDQVYYALSQVELTELGTTAHFAVMVLAFANSCFNPAIYSFSNRAYRHGIKEMLGCFCRKIRSTATNQLPIREPSTF